MFMQRNIKFYMIMMDLRVKLKSIEKKKSVHSDYYVYLDELGLHQ